MQAESHFSILRPPRQPREELFIAAVEGFHHERGRGNPAICVGHPTRYRAKAHAHLESIWGESMGMHEHPAGPDGLAPDDVIVGSSIASPGPRQPTMLKFKHSL